MQVKRNGKMYLCESMFGSKHDWGTPFGTLRTHF
jgi:hypothetical protein